MKLYRSTKDIHWFAFNQRIGWVIFPAEIGGWQKRQRASDIVLIDMHEVPLKMGFNTGIPGAREATAGVLDLPGLEGRPIVQHKRKGKVICLNCNLNGCVGRCRFRSVEIPPLLKSA